jgi:hypothetical protein
LKVMLAAIIVLALAIFLWAVVLYFTRRPEARPGRKEPWLENLEQLMKMPGGNVVPSHLAGMAHAVASSLEKLSEKIERSTESTERLGRVNLVLVWVIAVATVAYAVAAWLQLGSAIPAK